MCTTLRHTTVFTYSHANTPLGQSERAYYLSYFINLYNARSLRHTRALSTYARNLRQQGFCSLRNLTKFHGEMFSRMFNSCTIHSVQINSNRKKVNCLNFKKFFQLCVSLLEMISILVDSFRFLSLVVIQILNQYNLSFRM